ncbi:MAG: hypothetical protein ABIG31_03985, partial [Candidatus Omnitrophota bacterium]
IFDASVKHILQELSEKIKEFSKQQGRIYYLIAESDLNDSRVVWERKFGGFGVDAQWCDDFHHSLHTLLTGERNGYYADFGRIKDLEKSFQEGFVYSGRSLDSEIGRMVTLLQMSLLIDSWFSPKIMIRSEIGCLENDYPL